MTSSTGTTPARVILKLSGESFNHAGERGIGMEEVTQIARQVQQAAASGCGSAGNGAPVPVAQPTA